MKLLLIILALTALIHLVNTLAFSVRLSGVRTGQLATAYSLYNVIFLTASTANSVQIFLVPAIVDREINRGGEAATFLAGEQLVYLEQQMRIILGAATVGTIVGALLIPVFVIVFIRAMEIFEETGSVPKLIGRVLVSPSLLFSVTSSRKQLSKQPEFPLGAVSKSGPKSESESDSDSGSGQLVKPGSGPSLPIPKVFIGLNALVAGIYTTGVLSSIYAGALFPEARQTAITLAPVINGVATVMSAAVVDPTVANITDQALRGERSEEDVKRMVNYLSVSRVVGTVIAQAIFLPAAYLINLIAVALVG